MIWFFEGHYCKFPCSHQLLFNYVFNRFFKWEALVKLNTYKFSDKLRVCLNWDPMALLYLSCEVFIICNEPIVKYGYSIFLIQMRMSEIVHNLLARRITRVKDSKLALDFLFAFFERFFHLIEAVLFERYRDSAISLNQILLICYTCMLFLPFILT